MEKLLDKQTAYLAAYYFMCELDNAAPSDELKIWLGAMQLNVDGEPMDPAMLVYWSKAVDKAIDDIA